ncbi:PhoH family protein [uncultured Brachyspira sp.]|uniref:PhoH family protein n=1 Tax=uncultured Brachyspira sp. TaxID=221953 RepID=UPI00259BA55F|nr:PhoH family protein [uncultured Brachyspira sp.]
MTEKFIPNKKVFVFDTNVILHDFKSIFSFEETNIVIPITVLEEVDKFKKGSDTINFNAREFIRELDTFSESSEDKDIFTNGVILPNKSKIFVYVNNEEREDFKKIFSGNIPDHKILSSAYNIKCEDFRVVLITKDINMRMKARSLGINTQDYNTDKIEKLSSLFTGIENISGDNAKVYIEELKNNNEIGIKSEHSIYPNTYLCYRVNEEDEAVIGKYKEDSNTIIHVNTDISAYGIKPRNEEQAMALDILLDNSVPLVTVMGKAGTGKTLLALAAALEKRREYRQILLARPIVALSNKDLGFLPGDVNSKLEPYMQPLFDNLSVIQHIHSEDSDESKNIRKMLENEKIVISPLAYIRGRSLNKIYFIVDEAQNLTPHEIKTIITRAGEGTKIVFTGDIHQIDTPYLDERNNGLTYLIDRTKAEVLSGTVTLEKGERSKLAELAANVL